MIKMLGSQRSSAAVCCFYFIFIIIELLQVTCNFPRLSQLQIFEDYTRRTSLERCNLTFQRSEGLSSFSLTPLAGGPEGLN